MARSFPSPMQLGSLGMLRFKIWREPFEESIESERLRRDKEEVELQSIIAQIDQSEKDAQLAKLQEECDQRQLERERKKRHQL